MLPQNYRVPRDKFELWQDEVMKLPKDERFVVKTLRPHFGKGKHERQSSILAFLVFACGLPLALRLCHPS